MRGYFSSLIQLTGISFGRETVDHSERTLPVFGGLEANDSVIPIHQKESVLTQSPANQAVGEAHDSSEEIPVRSIAMTADDPEDSHDEESVQIQAPANQAVGDIHESSEGGSNHSVQMTATDKTEYQAEGEFKDWEVRQDRESEETYPKRPERVPTTRESSFGEDSLQASPERIQVKHDIDDRDVPDGPRPDMGDTSQKGNAHDSVKNPSITSYEVNIDFDPSLGKEARTAIGQGQFSRSTVRDVRELAAETPIVDSNEGFRRITTQTRKKEARIPDSSVKDEMPAGHNASSIETHSGKEPDVHLSIGTIRLTIEKPPEEAQPKQVQPETRAKMEPFSQSRHSRLSRHYIRTW